MMEMAIKMTALGFKGYFKDKYNIFDCFIVGLNSIDIIIDSFVTEIDDHVVYVFRSFRILRVLKIAKSWKKLQYLLATITNTLSDMRNFLILMFVFIYTYTILGLELFAYRIKFNSEGDFDPNGKSKKFNFDGFMNAFTTVFIIF